jgi:SAM-dependent methyltransferase
MGDKLTLNDVHNPSFEERVIELCEISTREMIIKFADQFVEKGCPACASDDRHLEITKWGLDYQRCEICRLVYISPYPNDDARGWYLENSRGLRFWRENMPEETTKSRLPLYLDRLNFIEKAVAQFMDGDQKLILEVGAGNGEMATILSQKNLFEEIILVEPQPLDVSLPSCRVIQAEISDIHLSKAADVVLAFEVIEHINEPKQFLHDLGKITVEGGVLIMSTPNVDGLEISCLGNLSNAYMFDHVRLYSPTSIRHILDQEGWDLLLVETPGLFDIEMIRDQFQAGRIDLATDPALRFICEADDAIRVQFQSFLQRQLLSSHMKLVARKRRSL